MDDVTEDPSPLEQELEALSAIYIDELTVSRTEDEQVKEISLLLHPATGDDSAKKFVCMNLVFHPTLRYPDEVPAISIRNPRGLGQEEMSSLVEDMKDKAEESVGEVMLYTLIEMAKDSLTEGNIPHSPCIVCLEHFHENSSFRRTACYHYFHNRCLHKYRQHVMEQRAEEDAENARIHHLGTKNKEKELICPMCRCPLDKETLAVHCSDSDGEDEEKFVPSPALRKMQQEMAEHFERQKVQGGIIDLEWEKNKYLVNAEDRVPLRASPQMSSGVNEEETEKAAGEQPQPSVNCVERNVNDKNTSRNRSPNTIQFHGRKFDNRRTGHSDHQKHHRGQGRVSRGFRERHRNLGNDRINEDGDGRLTDGQGQTSARYHNRDRRPRYPDNSYYDHNDRRAEDARERNEGDGRKSMSYSHNDRRAEDARERNEGDGRKSTSYSHNDRRAEDARERNEGDGRKSMSYNHNDRRTEDIRERNKGDGRKSTSYSHNDRRTEAVRERNDGDGRKSTSYSHHDRGTEAVRERNEGDGLKSMSIDDHQRLSGNERGEREKGNFKRGGWRERKRGGGGERRKEGAACASDNSQPDMFDARRSDCRSPSADSETNRPRDEKGSASHRQNQSGKFSRNTDYHSDDRREHQRYRTDNGHRRPRGRGRGGARGCRGAFNDAEHFGAPSKEDKQSYEEQWSNCGSERQGTGPDTGRSQQGRGSHRERQQFFHSSHKESYSSSGPRNQWRREREATGARPPDNRRNEQRRKVLDDEDEGAGIDPAAEDENGDLRNFEINQKWKNINCTPALTDHGVTMPRKFGVIDDNESLNDRSDYLREECSSEPVHADAVQRPNPNYYRMNGQIDYYYPGFNQGMELESWDDEVDPYASEISKFRNEELESYKNYKKDQDSQLSMRLKERVERERAVDEELRRVGKEQEQRRRRGDHSGYEVGHATGQSTKSTLSILEQFKQRQGNAKSESMQGDKCNTDKQVKHHEKETHPASIFRDASAERRHFERQHSHEGASSESCDEAALEVCDESFAQGKNGGKDAGHSIVSTTDIKWCGRKPQQNLNPPSAPLGDECDAEDSSLVGSDAYEQAWERRSILEKKSNGRCRKKEMKIATDRCGLGTNYRQRRKSHQNKDNPSDGPQNYGLKGKSYKDEDHPSEGVQSRINGMCEDFVKVSNDDQAFILQREFNMPRPLDLRKTNGHVVFPTKASDDVDKAENANKDGKNLHPSKPVFKKPKPIDFRKENRFCKDKVVHKSLHEITNDGPS